MPDAPILDPLDNAFTLYSRIAAELRRGVDEPDHPLHWLSVATIDDDGRPTTRLVIVRRFDSGERVLEFHTDRRSPKVRQLARLPQVTLLGYDPGTRLQVRIPARVSLHTTDAVADVAWEALKPGTRATYAAPDAPGAMLTADAPPFDPRSARFDNEFARGNFLVVLCQFEELEALELRKDGNCRVLIQWDDGATIATRLAP